MRRSEQLGEGHQADAMRGDPIVVRHHIGRDHFRAERTEDRGDAPTDPT